MSGIQNPASTLTTLGWIDVYSYLTTAQQTSVSLWTGVDVTTGIVAAIAAIPSTGGVLYFRPGRWVTSSGFTLLYPTSILGFGASSYPTIGGGVTQIECTSGSAVLFTLNSLSGRVSGIGFVCTGIAAAGSKAIYITNGASELQHIDICDNTFNNFDITVDMNVGWGWNFHDNEVLNSRTYGLSVNNAIVPDTGGWRAYSNVFTSGSAGIYVKGAGGGLIFGNKFVGGDTVNMVSGIKVDFAPVSGQLLIIGNNVDAVSGPAIDIPDGLDGILIYDNHLGCNSAGYVIDATGAPHISISSNRFKNDGAGTTAINLVNCIAVNIGDNEWGGLIPLVTSGTTASTTSIRATPIIIDVLGGTGLTVKTPNDNQIIVDTPGRFSSLLFNHGGSPRGQFYWDETLSKFNYNTFVAGAQIGFSSDLSVTSNDLVIAADHTVHVNNGDFVVQSHSISIFNGNAAAGALQVNSDRAAYVSKFNSSQNDCYNQLSSATGTGEFGIWSDTFYVNSYDNLANGIQLLEGSSASPGTGAGIWVKPASTNPIRLLGTTLLGAAGTLATNATDGFPYISTSAGPPTGTPTAYTGKVALEYDTSNSKVYFYNGAWQGISTRSGVLFDHFADAGNGTTVETDLYSDTTAAGQFAVNGDKIAAYYGGTFVSSGTATREIKIYFGGTVIFDTGTLTLSLSSQWTAYVDLIRVSGTVIRYMVSLATEGAALSAYTSAGELTGLTLSNTNILKITGQAAGIGAASNDIVAKLGSVKFEAAA